MEKLIGLEILVKVNGFTDARGWLHRLVEAGIVRCTSPERSELCERPATHIFWQDRAEWHPCCEKHRINGAMWTGSTRWNPDVLSLPVLPEPARAWVAAQPEEERLLMQLREYDRTDYYALLDDTQEAERVYLQGTAETHLKVYVDLRPLINGGYAYELVRGWGNQMRGTYHHYGLVGGFDNREAALEAAQQDENA